MATFLFANNLKFMLADHLVVALPIAGNWVRGRSEACLRRLDQLVGLPSVAQSLDAYVGLRAFMTMLHQRFPFLSKGQARFQDCAKGHRRPLANSGGGGMPPGVLQPRLLLP